MKKTILTFFIFALSFSMFAQSETRNYAVIDPDGWVNMRAGAGTHYEIIDVIDKHRTVHRDFDRQIINNWIPIIRFRSPHLGDLRGYIHSSRLKALENEGAQQVILPKESTVDVELRARLQQLVDEIDAMPLRHDTIRNRPDWASTPSLTLEIVSFDNEGRLRKYQWQYDMGDGASFYTIIIAYYDERGRLISIFYESGGNCDGESERYWVYQRRIVDFEIIWHCVCCLESDQRFTEAEINELRPVIGWYFDATTSVTRRMPLADSFLFADCLLIRVGGQPALPEWLRREWEQRREWEREN